MLLLQICKDVIYIIGTKKKPPFKKLISKQVFLDGKDLQMTPKKKKKHYLTIEYLCKRSYKNKHI